LTGNGLLCLLTGNGLLCLLTGNGLLCLLTHCKKRVFQIKSSEYIENPRRFLKTANLFASHLE